MNVIHSRDVFEKIGKMYSGLAEGSAIRESSVGDIASELQQNINKRLGTLVRVNGFDQDEARNIFGNMVLLEIIKSGRGADKDIFGRPMAGVAETALSENPGSVVQSIRDNAYFKAVTEQMDLDMLRQFVMTDRAKDIAEKMTKLAEKMYTNEKQSQEPQKQNEAEMSAPQMQNMG